MKLLPPSPIVYFPRPGRLSDYFRSRFRSLDIDSTTVQAVLRLYGLQPTGAPRNLPNTRRNRNLFVPTAAGLKVLKHYRADWTTATVAFEHSILQRLAELDIPAPRLVAAADGRTCQTLESGTYCLFDLIEGANYSSSFLLRSHRLTMMSTAGRVLAGLHHSLAGFLPRGQHHLGFRSYTADRHRDLDWHLEMIAELQAASVDLHDTADRGWSAQLIQRSAALQATLCELDPVLREAGLPRLIIHGDYGLHNLVFQHARRATPVDFELARLEWRLSDLVSVISKFRFEDGSYDALSILQFMLAYQAEEPIQAAEWEYFPWVWKYYKLMKAVQYWKSYFETGGPARKLFAALDELEHADWALTHPQQLAAFRAGA